MRSKPPTDYALLKEIYKRHRAEFPEYEKGASNRRSSKIFVPIDVVAIAKHFRVDEDSIFGRLYYHLEPKYGQPEEKKVFFTPKAGSDQNCINFPMLEAVLAGLRQEWRRDLLAVATAVVSFGIAIGSLVVSIVALAD
jgi:hypothetical protein